MTLISVLLKLCLGREVVVLIYLPTLDWSTDGSETRGARAIDRVFADNFVAAGLTQWVREPGNILDLILTSELDRVEDVRVLNPLLGFFHSAVVSDFFFGFGR